MPSFEPQNTVTNRASITWKAANICSFIVIFVGHSQQLSIAPCFFDRRAFASPPPTGFTWRQQTSMPGQCGHHFNSTESSKATSMLSQRKDERLLSCLAAALAIFTLGNRAISMLSRLPEKQVSWSAGRFLYPFCHNLATSELVAFYSTQAGLMLVKQ